MTKTPATLEPPRLAAPRLSLRSNFAWTLAGNVVYAACQWAVLVVLARLGNAGTVGLFALGLAVTAPVYMFSNLNLRSVQATDARHEYAFADYLGLRLLTILASGIVLVLFVLAAGHAPGTAAVILLVGLAKAFEAVSDVFYGLLQQHERMDRIAISMIARGVLSLAALTGALWLTGNVVGAVAAMAGVWALVLVFYDVPSGARVVVELRPRWRLAPLARLTWLTLPLGAVLLLISLNSNLPRYFFDSETPQGLAELGVFAALGYLAVAGGIVVSALGQSACPRLARHIADGDGRAFRRLLGKLVLLGAFLGLLGVAGAALLGREFLALVYRTEYAEHNDIFVWLMAAAGLGYVTSFLGYALTAARCLRPQTLLLVVVAATTAGACAVLMPSDRLRGAAVATFLAAAVYLAGSLVLAAWVCFRERGRGQ